MRWRRAWRGEGGAVVSAGCVKVKEAGSSGVSEVRYARSSGTGEVSLEGEAVAPAVLLK